MFKNRDDSRLKRNIRVQIWTTGIVNETYVYAPAALLNAISKRRMCHARFR